MGLKEGGLRGSLRNVSSVLPPFFDVSITSTNSPVTKGDVLDVDYLVDNTGDVSDAQDIVLEIDSVQEDVDSGVSLGGRQSATGTLMWDTSGETAADYTATVLSDDDSDSVTVTVESAIPDSGVFRLTFDDADTSGSTAADVWNDNDGTINGATTGVSGANQTYSTGEAYSFDGSDDYIDVGTPFAVDAAHSIALWANFDSLSSNDFSYVFEDANNLSLLQTNNNGNQELYVQVGTTVVTSGSLSTGTWYHSVVTFNPSGDVSLYVDGSSVASASWGSTGTVFGARGEIGGNNFAGKFEDADIDDVRAYNRELTPTEVSNLYNTGSISG